MAPTTEESRIAGYAEALAAARQKLRELQGTIDVDGAIERDALAVLRARRGECLFEAAQRRMRELRQLKRELAAMRAKETGQ